jgi:hypothetical protein
MPTRPTYLNARLAGLFHVSRNAFCLPEAADVNEIATVRNALRSSQVFYERGAMTRDIFRYYVSSFRQFAYQYAAMLDGSFLQAWDADGATEDTIEDAAYAIIHADVMRRLGALTANVSSLPTSLPIIASARFASSFMSRYSTRGPLALGASLVLLGATSEADTYYAHGDRLWIPAMGRFAAKVRLRTDAFNCIMVVDERGNAWRPDTCEGVSLVAVDQNGTDAFSFLARQFSMTMWSRVSAALSEHCRANHGRSWFGEILVTPSTRRCGMNRRQYETSFRFPSGIRTFTAFARNQPRVASGWRNRDAAHHGDQYPARPTTARVIRRRARLWNWDAIPSDVAAIMSRDLELHLDDPTE